MKKFFLKLLSQTKAGVLIEFALALPMIVLIVYFFIDISIVDEIQSKSSRVCSIVEQLSRTAVKRKLIQEDFLDFSKAAIITISGMPIVAKNNIRMDIIWTCLKGLTNGKRQAMWRVHTYMMGETIAPTFMETPATTENMTRIYHSSNLLSDSILSNLKLNTDQIAIVVEIFLSRSNEHNFSMFTYQLVKWPQVLGYAADFFIPNFVTYTDQHPFI